VGSGVVAAEVVVGATKETCVNDQVYENVFCVVCVRV
jgi:hypothetical protein